MSNINGGTIDGVPSKLLVYSESDENNQVKPHFHVHHEGTSYKTDMCIRLDIPKYANHRSHRGELNSRGKKDLMNLLNDLIIYDDEEMTTWRALVLDWNKKYDSVIIDRMPDYSELPRQSGSKKNKRKESTSRHNQ